MRLSGMVVTVLLLAGNLCGQETGNRGTGADSTRLVLWYTQSAQQWTEALPVGNRRLGAMVFGRISDERIQLNEDTTRLAGQAMMSRPPRIKSYQSLGDLRLDFPVSGVVTGYRRSLDLDTGVARTTYLIDGVRHTREVFASAPDNVLVVHIRADKPAGVTCTATVTRQQDANCISEGDDQIALRGQIKCPHPETGQNMGMRFEARVLARAKGGAVSSRAGALHVENADEVLLLVAGATSYRGGDPSESCRTALRAADGPCEQLYERHVASPFRWAGPTVRASPPTSGWQRSGRVRPIRG